MPDKQSQKTGRNSNGGKRKPKNGVVITGTILYEMEGVTHEVAKEALTLAAHKLPLKTKFVSREAYLEA